MKVTIATMIDSLITCSAKIYVLENIKREGCRSDEEIAEATRKSNTLNVQRNTLIEEIDLALNDIAMGEKQQLFGANKMYGS